MVPWGQNRPVNFREVKAFFHTNLRVNNFIGGGGETTQNFSLEGIGPAPLQVRACLRRGRIRGRFEIAGTYSTTLGAILF